MLDSKFRPDYNLYMAQDRLHRERDKLQSMPPIIC